MTEVTTAAPEVPAIAETVIGNGTADQGKTAAPAKPARARRQSAASRKSAANAASKIAAAPKAGKPTAKAELAAKPKVAKADTGPTKTARNRILATEFVKIAADRIAKWSAADVKRTGSTKDEAALAFASWLNYAPVPVDGWDDRLPDRSSAGGRGAKNRKAA